MPLPALHDVLILRRSGPPADACAASPYRCVEWTADGLEHVQQALLDMGRRIPTERSARRFRNGLRFFVLQAGGQAVASSWLVHGGTRYIDELNWSFPVPADACWLRDIHVSTPRRGQGVFVHFVQLLAAGLQPACRCVWSDVDASNAASLRAHQKAGFEIVTRLRALDIGGRLRLRGGTPAWSPAIQELDPGRRIVLLTGERLQRHRSLIA